MITLEIKKKINNTEFSVGTTVENKEEAKRELKELHEVIEVIDDLLPQSSGKEHTGYVDNLKSLASYSLDIGFPDLLKPYPMAPAFLGRPKPADYGSPLSTYLALIGYPRGPVWELQRLSLPSVEKTVISPKSLKKSPKSY